jgi:hypothetical protein
MLTGQRKRAAGIYLAMRWWRRNPIYSCSTPKKPGRVDVLEHHCRVGGISTITYILKRVGWQLIATSKTDSDLGIRLHVDSLMHSNVHQTVEKHVAMCSVSEQSFNTGSVNAARFDRDVAAWASITSSLLTPVQPCGLYALYTVEVLRKSRNYGNRGCRIFQRPLWFSALPYYCDNTVILFKNSNENFNKKTGSSMFEETCLVTNVNVLHELAVHYQLIPAYSVDAKRSVRH